MKDFFRIKWFLFYIFLLCFSTSIGQTLKYVSGATVAQFNITDQGAATYTIPIKVPPGTTGLIPKISLMYSSNGGNSVAGVGWSVLGFSQIGTGSRTLSEDNPDSIKYINDNTNNVGTKSTDVMPGLDGRRYYLDGERLALAEEPTVNDTFNLHYGKGKRNYYTEQFNFSKISVTDTYFSPEGSPNAFEVKTKDGLTWEYGIDDSSRLAANQFSPPRTWLVRKIKDTRGNYIKYNYDKADPIQYYPTSIEYTGNEKTGLQPYNKIVFIYEYRPDGIVKKSYQEGYQTIIGQRLKEIDVYCENKLSRKYVLTYIQSSINNNSLLQSITECDSSNNCFNPLIFEYTDNNELDFSKHSNLTIPAPLPNSGLTYPGDLDNQLVQGDWDNNGMVDFLSYSPTKKKYQFTIHDTKQDTIYNIDYQGLDLSRFSNSQRIYFYPCDIQSDGQTDLIVIDPDSGFYRIFINRTTRFGSPTQYFFRFVLADTTTFLLPKDILKDNRFALLFNDWNKDGLTDIILYNYKAYSQQPSFYFIKNKSIDYDSNGGTLPVFQTEQRNIELPLVLGHDYVFDFSDYTNDGLTDILAWDKTAKDFHLFIKASDTGVIYNESAHMNVSFSGLPNSTLIIADDFNGDGITDIFIFDTTNGNNKLILRNFDGTAVEKNNLINTGFLKDIRGVTPCDLNNNGLVDLLITNSNSTNSLYFLKDIVNGEPAQTFAGIDNSEVYLRNPGILGRFTKNGPIDIFLYNNLSNKSSFYSLNGYDRNQISKITNSNNLVAEIDYTDLIDGENNDVDDPKAPYPLGVYFSGICVVNTLRTDNGVGGKNIEKYQFLVPYYNLEGRGFRGFGQIVTIDSVRKIRRIRQFNFQALIQTSPETARQIHKFVGSPLQFSWSQSFDPSLGLGDFTLTEDNYQTEYKSYFNASSFSYTKQTITNVFEVFAGSDGTTSIPTTKRVQYDDYGNVLAQVTDYGDGQIDSVANVYDNDLNNWFLGRLIKTTLYSFKPGSPTTIRTSAYEYDFLTGLLIKEILYPDSSNHYTLTKEYVYDAYGNVIRSQETSWNGYEIETRAIETTYDPMGRFVVATKNALAQTQLKEIDPRFGMPTKVTSPNGIASYFEYDGLGRPMKETFPDGNWSRTRYLNASDTTSIPLYCSYLIIKESSNNPPEYNYYDKLDRLIETITVGFNGTHIVKKINFDERGYVTSETEPYFESDAASAVENQYKYDYRGRLIEVDRPFKNTIAKDRITYRNKQKILTNSLGQTKTENYDGKDQLTEIIDNEGNSLKYQYTATGSMAKTIDPKNNSIEYTYDFRGKQASCKDPDIGFYKYNYNGFGELIQQISSKGDTTSIKYDKLGRIVEKKQKEGLTTYVYDSRTGGIGKLASISGLNGYVFEVYYDSYGRRNKEKETIGGKSFETMVTYNNLGKENSITYPGGFIINFLYDNAGFLSKIFRQSDNYTIWNALKINAKGQLVQYTLGNKTSVTRYIDNQGNTLDSSIVRKQNGTKLQSFGYQFNSIGQLTQRSNALIGKSESFEYDKLNRLIKTQIDNTSDTVIVSYDELGNITYKSDVGYYKYGGMDNGPHQVKQILVKDKVCIPGFNVATEFNSFNKVSKIEKDSVRLEIYYNANNQRCLQKFYIRDSLIKTKYYVSNSYEYTTKGDTIIEANFVRDYEGVTAVYYKNNKTGTSFQYLHKDHIGSTTLITDSVAGIIAELSYDAWGKRRKADWSYSIDSSLNLLYERGFTGHEHYDLFDIIDMNGRIYDAVIGRFLSPDPNISEAENLQSYNRYSYVLNNPLTLTDPSGYFSFGDAFRSIGNAIASIGKAFYNVEVGFYKLQWKYRKEIAIAAIIIATAGSATPMVVILSGAAIGFVSGFEGSLSNGSSFKDALNAGVTGAIIGGLMAGVSYGFGATAVGLESQGLTTVGYNVLASGVRNGFVETLQGGSFEHGFMQGAKQGAINEAAKYATYEVGELGKYDHQTNLENVVFKSVSHGVVQGISAKLSGGQFRDGFIVGAAVSSSQLLINNTNPSYRVMLSGLVGGTASELSGGKFANGAAGGMMIRMYNEDKMEPTGWERVEHAGNEIQYYSLKAIYNIFYGEPTSKRVKNNITKIKKTSEEMQEGLNEELEDY